jgi:hypothetical protein
MTGMQTHNPLSMHTVFVALRRRGMLMRVVVACTVGVVHAAVPSRLRGQPDTTRNTSDEPRVSVDITLGPSVVRGGLNPFVNRDGAELAILVGLNRPPREGPMHAVSLGRRSNPLYELGCFADGVFGRRTGPCAPVAPVIFHLGFLSGFEVRRSSASVRAMLGPAIYYGEKRPGIGGRFHISAGVGLPLAALTVGVSGNSIMLLNGTPYRYYSAAFGVRAQ